MMRDWNSPVYAFFGPTPDIAYIDNRRCHIFKCLAKGCDHKVRRFLDKGDKASTGNMRKHIRSCWGEDILSQVVEVKNIEAARDLIGNHTKNGSITVSFKKKGKGKVTYSHRQHTRAETRYSVMASA
jgi:hypothetical protein